MRFTDFLRATVMLSMASASALALCTVLGSARDGDRDIVLIGVGWWIVAAGIGVLVGRRTEVSGQIGGLLAQARAATSMPEHRPGAVVVNRLWPLLLATVVAVVLSFYFVQVAAVAAGFAIIWSLSWRHQESAVQAIEERDGVTFFVERSSPVTPMRLQRTPGLRRDNPKSSTSHTPST